MPHLPFARKYRPKAFADLIGQPHVTMTLTRALEQKRVGQAYLFTGQRGVGKTSAARILAKALNCEKGPTASPCSACASCAQIAQGTSLDVMEIDGASNRGIDEIRSLRETVAFAPTMGAFRIYIIDEVHMLTTEAFNALLKTLEEPPAHVKFIFATTVANKVPSTILSRCQRFDFRRLEASTVVGALKQIGKAEQVPANDAALYAIARASEGSLRDAEVILEQLASFVAGTIEETHVTELLGAVESEALFAWVQAILDHQPAEALVHLQRQLEQGREPSQLLMGLMRQLRNLLVLRTTADSAGREALLPRLVDEPAERLKQLDAQAAACTVGDLMLSLQTATAAYELLRRSPMAQTILELVVIRLASREEWHSLAEISKRLEQLGAGTPAASSAPRPGSPISPGLGVTTQPPSAAERRPAPAVPAAKMEAALPADPAQQLVPLAAVAAPGELMRLWPAVLERLGAQKMSLAAYLAHAAPMGLDGTVMTVGLPGFALHQEVLSLTDNRRLIDRILTEVYGQSMTVAYATLPEPAQSAIPQAAMPEEAGAPSIVQDIVDLFNATVSDQPRPT